MSSKLGLGSTLVFGASGPVGGFLLPRLAALGGAVFAVSRQPPQALPQQAGITWLHGDLFGETPMVPELRTIVSVGPLDAFAEWFERNASSGTELDRVIALSSMSAQTKRDSTDAAERDVSERLRVSEGRLFAAAQARAIECTIFRPTLIYGSGRDRSLAPIARFAHRWRVLPVPLGAHGLRQPVHAADLADACVGVRDNASTFGKIYALGGAQRLRFDMLLRQIAAGPPRIAVALPLPLWLLRLGLRLAPQRVGAGALARLNLPLIADNEPARRDFGYSPRAFRGCDVFG